MSKLSVVFVFGRKAYPPIDFISLPPKSIAAHMAIKFMHNRCARVPLDNSFKFDPAAVDSVICTLAGLFDNEPAQGVKHNDMCAMRVVCDALGFNFDQLIRPRFYTLGTSEACVYELVGCGERGTIRFVEGRVVIDYSGFDRLVGSFEYRVLSGRILVHAPSITVIDVLPNGNLALTSRAYTAGAHAIFNNTTPDRLCAPPAAPGYTTSLPESTEPRD
jgi:hypothetical protein